MNPTPRSTIIEFFYPGGFAYDYEWTTRALNMIHYGFWGSEYVTATSLHGIVNWSHLCTELLQVQNCHQVRFIVASEHKLLKSHVLLVAYPTGVNGDEGFQGNSIPLDGKKVAELIHWRLSLAEEGDD